eukprot:3289677-Amphidinium_carterae.1
MDGQTMVSLESMMWDSIVSPQCSTLVRQQLQEAELAQDFQRNGTQILKAFGAMARAAPIIRDNFNPVTDVCSLGIHLWFTWLTETQYTNFKDNGTVPGHKDTKGDSVHKHHRLHNTPDHCVNLHIHNRWNAASDNDDYTSTNQ